MDELVENTRMNQGHGMKRGLESRQSSRQSFRHGDSVRARGDAVEVHIEELVLHGFASGDRYRIGDAVQQELARLLEINGFPATVEDGIRLERLVAGTFRVRHGAQPHAVGEQTAAMIDQGFRKTMTKRR